MIEVISGPMFAGKTEELIRRLRRVTLAGVKMQAFKPRLDTRYTVEEIVSHDARRLPVESVEHSAEIGAALRPHTKVVGIDEAQFFDHDLVHLVENLARDGRRIIIAGLDLTSDGRPFGPMPALLAVADQVTKLSAICALCGAEASRSARVVPDEAEVLVGGSEAYQARCRRCWR